jgi:hypothetical protein
MPTPKGVIFATTNNYQWSVSMLDAKFTAPNNANDEKKQPFRLEASGALGTISDYGTIYVCVRYFGPGTTSAKPATSMEGLVRVQAFTTPDFSGVPAGEGWVTNVTQRANQDVMSVNAVIRGVPPGTYYVRAFIDTDGDCTKDTWESWGYGCYVGAADAPISNVMRGDSVVTAADFPYTPRAYVVAVGAASPVADVYIEDADTDNDGLPDVYEMETYGVVGSTTSPKGNSFFTKVNPNLSATVNAYTKLGAKAGGGSTTYAVMTLMNALISESDPAITASAAALLSAAPDAEVAEESTVVTIRSFSLEDGAQIAVETAVPPAASGQSVVVTTDRATVDLYLSCASTLEFADAVEVKVKSFTIRANETTTMKVSAEELAAAKARAPEAKFFKAIIR